MKIRKDTTNDMPRLEEIFLITRQATFKNRSENFKIGDYLESTVDDKVWIGELDGVIVGFISVYSQDNFIHNLFVDQQYQGKGFGSQLLLFAEGNLSYPITLKVAMDNLKACPFYEKYGYYKVAEFNKTLEPYILYRKDS